MTSKTKYCPYCSSNIESSSVFCQNCGASITEIDEKTPIAQPSQQNQEHTYSPVQEQKVADFGTVSLIT